MLSKLFLIAALLFATPYTVADEFELDDDSGNRCELDCGEIVLNMSTSDSLSYTRLYIDRLEDDRNQFQFDQLSNCVWTNETDSSGFTNLSSSLTFDVAGSTVSVTLFVYVTSDPAGTTIQGVTIYPGQVKTGIDVSGWPFTTDSGNLTLRYKVKSEAEDSVDLPDGDASAEESDDDNAVLSFSNTNLAFATSATIDGVSTPVILDNSTSGEETEVRVIFPPFTTSLSYDPVLSPSSAISSAPMFAIMALLFSFVRLFA